MTGKIFTTRLDCSYLYSKSIWVDVIETLFTTRYTMRLPSCQRVRQLRMPLRNVHLRAMIMVSEVLPLNHRTI